MPGRKRDFTFGTMSVPELTLYKILSKKLWEQEAHEVVEFIYSEVRAQMEEVNADLNTKTTVFLNKEDKIDLIDRIDITKSDLIDRIDFSKSDLSDRIDITKSGLINRIDITKSDLTDRINKVRKELIVWIVGVSLLQYILLMVTRKFF